MGGIVQADTYAGFSNLDRPGCKPDLSGGRHAGRMFGAGWSNWPRLPRAPRRPNVRSQAGGEQVRAEGRPQRRQSVVDLLVTNVQAWTPATEAKLLNHNDLTRRGWTMFKHWLASTVESSASSSQQRPDCPHQ